MNRLSRPTEAIQTTVARVVLFIPVFLLVGFVSNSLSDRPPMAALALPLACVLLSLIADGAIAWLGRARGRMLAKAVGAQALLWAGIVGGVLLLSQLDQEPTRFSAVAQPLIFFGLLTLGIALLPRTQAVIAWALGSAGAAVRFTDSLFLVPILPGGSTTFVFAGGLLVAGSLGILALYIRRLLARKGGLGPLAQRLAFVGAAVCLSVAVSVVATVFVTQSTVTTQSFERLQADRGFLEGVSRQLGSRFTQSELLIPSPTVAGELAGYASLQNAGLTIYDMERARVVLAIRRSYEGSEQSGRPRLQAVRLSANEAEEIGRVVRTGSTEVGRIDAIGARQPSWTELGYADGKAHPDHTVAVSASPYAAPKGSRLALVLTDAEVDWMKYPSISVNEISTGYANLVAPWLFLAFMLPCTLGLLALERRDVARARVGALEERARLNRDAHDRIYNRLTALANKLEATQSDRASEPKASKEIRAAVHDLQTILGDGILAKRLVAEDAVTVLLSDVCDERARALGMEVMLKGADALRGLDPRLGWGLHCVVSEALTNAGLHGRATHATVDLGVEDGVLRMRLCDDGTGIRASIDDQGAAIEGSGVKGMRERVEAFGGRLSVVGGSSGTTVFAEIPLKPQRPGL